MPRINLVTNMRVSVAVVFCVVLAIVRGSLRTDQQYWAGLAKNELQEALKVRWNLNTAKNVILFIGDGMGPNTVTATRIYKGGESHRLVFEKFPHVGLLKTYSADKMVPDSACTATALFSGIKTNQDTVGVDATVKHKDCDASLKPEARVKSLAAVALEAGKSAGFVTTMRVTHATPSPLYAHSASRKWECDDFMPPNAKECKDIARQLVEDWPGRDLNVIMGGGLQVLVSNPDKSGDGAERSKWNCARKDGRNLIEDYKKMKEKRGLKYSVVTNNEELRNIDEENTDYLLGIFAKEHLAYEHQKRNDTNGEPSLIEMVEAAIKVLRRNKNGYFLMVEGGNVDMAHHRGWAKRAIDEAAAMEAAVQLAASMTDEEDTLLIVTSDHSHTLSINGYPDRGSNIFGVVEPSPIDGINYTTLSYSTGGPEAYQYYVATEHNETLVKRREPTLDDTEKYDYNQVAGIQLAEDSHGGGDVAIYARGPYSHLFHNVHEQNYVFHAISFAAKMGEHSKGKTVYANVLLITGILALCLLVKL